jgi:hypothetical protein
MGLIVKKTILVVAFFILSTFTAHSKAKNEYQYFSSTDKGKVYVSVDSISKDGNIRTAWVLAVFNETSITGTKKQESLKEFDCKSHTSKTLKLIAYNEQDKITETVQSAYSLIPKTAYEVGTMEELLATAICKEKE